MEQYRVLLAEDEAVLRDMLQDFFEMQEYEIDVAENGAEAFELWQKNEYSIVISDINMPIMSGLELLQNIKQIKKDFPVILVTGVTIDKAKNEASEYGADRFLSKPFKMLELFKQVETLATPV